MISDIEIEQELISLQSGNGQLRGDSFYREALCELIALRKAFSEPYGYVHQGVYEAGFSSGLSADHEAYKNSSTHIPLYRKP